MSSLPMSIRVSSDTRPHLPNTSPTPPPPLSPSHPHSLPPHRHAPLCWNPEMQASLISKHLDSRSAYCCEFLLHEGSLHLLIGEEGPTLRSLNYSKHLTESRRGTILVPRAPPSRQPAPRFTRIVLPPDRSSGQGQDQIHSGADAVSARQQRTALRGRAQTARSATWRRSRRPPSAGSTSCRQR